MEPEEVTLSGAKLTELAEAMAAQGFELELCERIVRRAVIVAALRYTRGNVCEAARRLKVHRNTLSRALSEFEIKVRPFRQRAA